jgi:hypothetical protein
MYYLSFKGFGLALTNNLEKAINEVLIQYNRVLVADIELDAFKKEMLDALEECNKNNPRCKPYKFSWWDDNLPNGGITLSGVGGRFMFTIYKSHSSFFPKPKH